MFHYRVFGYLDLFPLLPFAAIRRRLSRLVALAKNCRDPSRCVAIRRQPSANTKKLCSANRSRKLDTASHTGARKKLHIREARAGGGPAQKKILHTASRNASAVPLVYEGCRWRKTGSWKPETASRTGARKSRTPKPVRSGRFGLRSKPHSMNHGNSGLRYDVDHYYKRLFGFAALTSAFSAAFDLSQRTRRAP
jgi:hypothetical protein